MDSYTYQVKVRSSHLLEKYLVNGEPPQIIALPELQDPAHMPPMHTYATYLWGGGGLFFYDTQSTQNLAISPIELIGPRSQLLTVHVDVDGTPIDLYAASKTAPDFGYTQNPAHGSPSIKKLGLFYLGRMRPGQVASFRLGGLHGLAAFCNAPSGSDTKVTCVLLIDPIEPLSRPV